MNVRCGLLLCTVLLLTGCAGESTPPPSTQEMGATVETQVTDFVSQTRENPKSGQESLALLMESLEAYATDYQGPYVELRDAGKKLQDLYTASAPKTEIDAQLEVLAQKGAALK